MAKAKHEGAFVTGRGHSGLVTSRDRCRRETAGADMLKMVEVAKLLGAVTE